VPLDPSGRHGGSVLLHVEELPAPLVPHAAPLRLAFLVAGGPGQASTASFDLEDSGRFLQSLLPGYILVAYDDRGTGKSGLISCPGLGNANPAALARNVGACGRLLGATRSFYSTRENAADMDAVRRALGVDRVTVFGVSYGTKQALAYAAAYPSHVDRLVLDSVDSLDQPDPFSTASLKALPHALDEICFGACQGMTPSPGSDFVTLANQLAASPVTASVPRPGERPAKVRLDGQALIDLGYESDLNAGIAAELPGAVSAGLASDLLPLERLVALLDQSTGGTSSDFSDALNVATNCTDGPLPWSPLFALSRRPALVQKAIAALPPGATGPFGSWAASDGLAGECVDWPAGPAGPALRVGPLPNVPVLILSGGRDVRTPTSEARQVAADFPRSRFLVVEGSGHDVTDSSGCADQFVAAWVSGRRSPGCQRVPLVLSPLGAFPPPAAPSLAKLTSAQTLAVALNTLHEAEATFFINGGHTLSAGLAGGVLRSLSSYEFRLSRYADASGVTLNGTATYSPSAPGGWAGQVTVGGARAVHGALFDDRHRLSGTLG
jgi:pimeloyl-ACP methyl ester carboxylesterase